MKKILISICIMAMAIGVSAARETKVTAGKNYQRYEITEITNFSKIKVTGSHHIEYTQSADGSTAVSLYCPSNIKEYVEIYESGGTLTIRIKKGVRIEGNPKIQVYARSPQMNGGEVTGSGKINFMTPVNTDGLDMSVTGSGSISGSGIVCKGKVSTEVTGSGSIKLEQISAADIKSKVTGSGSITLSGKTERAHYSTMGSGSVRASGLEAGKVYASTTGSGSIKCWAVGELEAETSGSGGVRYKGDPAVRIRGSKANSVTKL